MMIEKKEAKTREIKVMEENGVCERERERFTMLIIQNKFNDSTFK